MVFETWFYKISNWSNRISEGRNKSKIFLIKMSNLIKALIKLIMKLFSTTRAHRDHILKKIVTI